MTPSSAAVAHAGELLRRRIGLRIEASLYMRLARAVSEAAQRAGQDPEDFVAGLNDDASSLQHLCDRVTVQESGFFRHPEHFAVMTRRLLPAMSGPVRIWSAASGNGQEPYSVAMALAEQGIDGRVLATDISSDAVRRTREARYDQRELSGLSERRLRAHGTMTDSTWTVAPALRARVDVSLHNLLDPLPNDIRLCQIVWCRNVLIYLTAEHAAEFLDRLADVLSPDAYLFLGGAESMLSVSDRFEPLHLEETFVYRTRRQTTRSATKPIAMVSSPQRTAWPERRLAPTPSDRPARARQRDRLRRPAGSTTTPTVSVVELARLGLDAYTRGDHAQAVRLFRNWAYVAPGDPIAYFHLGLAHDGTGDRAAAVRCFGICRALLSQSENSGSVDAFGGYGRDDVLRMIESKETLDR